MKDKFFYNVISFLDMIVFNILFFPKVKGKNNIPKSGPFIIVCNHTKWLDPVMLIAIVRRNLHFLAKKELFEGVFKHIIKGIGCIPVNRKIKDKNCVDLALKTLNMGNNIAIFPEGTINRSNDYTLPFKMGAVSMAKKTNTPIIPFIITGKYKLFGGIKVKILEPIKITGDLEKENERLRNIYNKELEMEHENNKKR